MRTTQKVTLRQNLERTGGYAVKPKKGKWICPFRKPSKFYALLDKKGNVVKTSYEKDLHPKKGQKVVEKIYDGCPEWKNIDVLDAFDFGDKEKSKDDFDF